MNEKTVKELFNNCASRIIGLKSIGTKNFGAADITETGKFADEIDKINQETTGLIQRMEEISALKATQMSGMPHGSNIQNLVLDFVIFVLF